MLAPGSRGQAGGYLPATLAPLRTASAGMPCELIVVGSESSDATRDIATRHGALVVSESVHNIGKVKNTGAGAAAGDILVFIDADTVVPPALLAQIAEVMGRENCLGDALAVAHTEFRRPWMKWYLKG